MRTLFVTGTDTGVGKTYVSCLLLKALAAAGVRALPFKPVAAGAELGSDGHWYNDDGLALQQACAQPLPYALINPVTLPDPLSPHLAAARRGCSVTVAGLLGAAEAFTPLQPELLLVEGAGGWRVPLNGHETLADLAKALLADERAGGVVLVVGMRLGCLNHALLTAEAIRADGLALLGWLVLAVGVLLVSFPLAHGIILTALYLPVFALLFGLMVVGGAAGVVSGVASGVALGALAVYCLVGQDQLPLFGREAQLEAQLAQFVVGAARPFHAQRQQAAGIARGATVHPARQADQFQHRRFEAGVVDRGRVTAFRERGDARGQVAGRHIGHRQQGAQRPRALQWHRDPSPGGCEPNRYGALDNMCDMKRQAALRRSPASIDAPRLRS